MLPIEKLRTAHQMTTLDQEFLPTYPQESSSNLLFIEFLEKQEEETWIVDNSHHLVLGDQELLLSQMPQFRSNLSTEVPSFVPKPQALVKETQVQLPKNLESEQSSLPDQSSYSASNVSPKPKKRKNNKEPYPTKNFLPSFRTSFLSFLKRFYRKQNFNTIPIIYRIQHKKCINLKDYEDLFNYPEFRPLLEKYFQEKVIIRDLMLSRIEEKTKRYYFSKIYVFEQAFRSGVFAKINY